MMNRSYLKNVAESKRNKLEEALNRITEIENEEIVVLATELFDGDMDNAVD